MRRLAFTLVELLVVVAIIAVLVAISFPVFAVAKRAAKKSATMSNLRQCGVAALIYEGDAGDLPDSDSVAAVLEGAPTCDAMDYWRGGCSVEWGVPLVGSYGYVRGIEVFRSGDDWGTYKATLPNYPMFAAVWYADQKLAPFAGDAPSTFGNGEGSMMPNRILYVMHDGSILNWNSKKYRKGPDNQLSGWAFTWPNVFNEDLFKK